MKTLKLPTGITVVFNGTEQENQSGMSALQRRIKFVDDECKRRGWPPPSELTMEQIMEIRKMPGWKDP